MARLKGVYKNELVLKLKEELALENVMQVPRITKITLNMGVGGGRYAADFWPETRHYSCS